MRDIKFEYIYSDGLNKIREIFTLDEISNGDCYDVFSDSPLLAKFVIIAKRQYTGLKDKNGVEIYEGDIIDYAMLHTEAILGMSVVEQTGTGVIEYYISYFRILNPFTLSHSLRDDNDFKCEIIGNIYENPELLKS